LLNGSEVHFAPFAGSRDPIGTARAALWGRRFLKDNPFDIAVSTGASIAVAILPLAAATGTHCYYVESATRTTGPSLTGHLLRPFGQINLRTQYPNWAGPRWKYEFSVFDGFKAVASQATELRRIVVTLGTSRFGFRRLVDRLIDILPMHADVLWQVGSTDMSGLDVAYHRALAAVELNAAIADSDVVIAHAGVGSAITALAAGKLPVLVPRQRRYKEHVDDHQRLLADELSGRGLAEYSDVSDLNWSTFVRAASWQIDLSDDWLHELV
jgi:UDP-N-acetylglucosamine transferase subunit ALG13